MDLFTHTNQTSDQQRAKEIHKHLMAKESLNESRKSTIQKVVALTTHSKSSEHSASSLENKSSNGTTRSEKEVVALKAEKQKLQHELKNTTNTSIASVKSKKNEKKTTITFVKAAANKNSANSNEKLVKVLVQKQTEKKKNADAKKNHLPSPSVQKAPRQVPNSHHAKSHQKVPPSPHGSHIFVLVVSILDQVDTRSKQVDTRSGLVDTRPSFQQTSLLDWDSRSTLDQGRSAHSGKNSKISCKPSFQEEGQGNQRESLERRLLCKAREQIQLKRLRRRRISGISDAIKAEHRQLRRISIDFHQGS
ncbi:hypothetical protein Taro_023727 [Colocasia esculenta]|uniref:Uncharacterized protein n=1 Tax=Colocasia esculenta TaxID=4460 RepID=A0A843V7A4_COLES|nr:hypothetical protein [Colocasia esculenta]